MTWTELYAKIGSHGPMMKISTYRSHIFRWLQSEWPLVLSSSQLILSKPLFKYPCMCHVLISPFQILDASEVTSLLHINITSRVLYVAYWYSILLHMQYAISISIWWGLEYVAISKTPMWSISWSWDCTVGIRHLKPLYILHLDRIFFSLLWKSAMVGIGYNFSILMDDPGVQSVQTSCRILFGKWHGDRNYTRKLLNMAG